MEPRPKLMWHDTSGEPYRAVGMLWLRSSSLMIE